MRAREDPVARRLRAAGVAEVDDSTRRRAEYAADGSIYRYVPRAVVFPRDDAELTATVAVCRELGVPVTLRGGGTSTSGQALGHGVVVDCSRHLHQILDVDPASRTARVQPGVVLAVLNEALRPHGLRFGPDPATGTRCTLGGMIGNDSCGARSLAWGRTGDNVEELRVSLDDGTPLVAGPHDPAAWAARLADPGRVGQLCRALDGVVTDHLSALRTELDRFRRQVSGYGLHHLLPERRRHLGRSLVGTEGTLAVVHEATIRLVPIPAATAVVAVGFESELAAARAVPAMLAAKPNALESLDARMVRAASFGDGGRALPAGEYWLLAELAGDVAAEAADRADRARSAWLADVPGVVAATRLAPEAARQVWALRSAGVGLASHSGRGRPAWPGWEDAAVPPEKLATYLERFRALLAEFDYDGFTFGHFGEGCFHIRIDADLTADAGREAYTRFVERAADLIGELGGSLSGEHGDGRSRSALLPRMYSAEMIEAFTAVKTAWDPAGLFNPGVKVHADPVGARIRVLPTLLDRLRTFAGRGNLVDAHKLRLSVERCVGIGRCRSTVDDGGMCPSYRATRDEKDSTRGRARVLQEMMRGELIVDGWRSKEVLQSLDLCLSCKACLHDCPNNVDMAALKSEFLYRHFRHRLRPRSHYSMGWLPVALRLGAVAPAAVRVAAGGPRRRRLLGALGGMDASLPWPLPARTTLRRLLRRAGLPHAPAAAAGDAAPGRPPVLLWTDTFTSHLSPEAGVAAVRVLQDAGYEVRLGPRGQCCGLTWISTGQRGVARALLARSARALAPAAAAGIPIVVVEPSCASALRDELPRFVDGAAARQVAAAVRGLADVLAEAPNPPSGDVLTGTTVAVQTHCHQAATAGNATELDLLRGLGADVRPLPDGCCGLAGDFGMTAGHGEVSRKVAEHAMLPALAAMGGDTVVLADGFSCRTQIERLSPRRTVHLAQLIANRTRERAATARSAGPAAPTTPDAPPAPAADGGSGPTV